MIVRVAAKHRVAELIVVDLNIFICRARIEGDARPDLLYELERCTSTFFDALMVRPLLPPLICTPSRMNPSTLVTTLLVPRTQVAGSLQRIASTPPEWLAMLSLG